MKAYHINTEASVKQFLNDIYTRYNQYFDPADDITSLPADNGSPFFTLEEGTYLDEVMLSCFVYCVYNKLDIYDLAEEVSEQIFPYHLVQQSIIDWSKNNSC